MTIATMSASVPFRNAVTITMTTFLVILYAERSNGFFTPYPPNLNAKTNYNNCHDGFRIQTQEFSSRINPSPCFHFCRRVRSPTLHSHIFRQSSPFPPPYPQHMKQRRRRRRQRRRQRQRRRNKSSLFAFRFDNDDDDNDHNRKYDHNHTEAFITMVQNDRPMISNDNLINNHHEPSHDSSTNQSLTPPVSVPINDFTGAGTLGDIMSTPSNDPKLSDFNQRIKHDTAALSSLSNHSFQPLSNDCNPQETISSSIHKADNGNNYINNNKNNHTISSPISREEGPDSGLVTTAGGTLSAKFAFKMKGYISPLERIALTANGNLQRIFSSYYDAPVHVIVDQCQLRPSSSMSISQPLSETLPSKSKPNSEPAPTPPAIWDRSVHLSVHNQTFCTAFSKITVHSQECIALVCSGKIGIGQIFTSIIICSVIMESKL